jgi:lipopolysaccharide heptosyltransferase II
MAEAFHTLPLKHHMRRALLHTVAWLPVMPARLRLTGRILLIRPDHLGDVLLTTPAVRALRATLPRAEIHALIGPWSANVIGNYDEVDQVLTLPFPGFSREAPDDLGSPYRLVWRASRQLRRIGYDSAIVFRPDHWWGALLAFLSGIPERIGYNLPDTAPFLTQRVPFRHEHAVMQNMRLAQRWTGATNARDALYSFPIEPMDRGYIDGYLQEWDIAPDSSLICIHPGTGTWVKHWEEARWATIADTLKEEFGLPVVFTGSDGELQMVRRIAGQMRHRPCIMAGETKIGQLAALYARALVVLGPDSGPLHLATAVDAPTVTLFGPADPHEFGPWGSPDRHIILASSIACRPCRILDWADDDPDYHPCLRDITVAQVLDAARRAAANHD